MTTPPIQGSMDNNFRSEKFESRFEARSKFDDEIKGDEPEVCISDVDIDYCINECRFSLIGRLDFQKNSLEVAGKSLKSQWRLKGDYQLIPLGKGFFVIKLENAEDKTHVWSGFWEVETQSAKLRNWEPNFKPANQKSSIVFV